jgi:hypothetical protein
MRVKAVHPQLRQLLREGHGRSQTFRRVISEIEVSSWIVFVQAGQCPEKSAVACLLHVVGRSEGAPYVRPLTTVFVTCRLCTSLLV